MALTLLEQSKLLAANGEIFRAGVIETYAETNPLLRVLPFENIQGNALRYNREQTLPGVGFRGVNEAYTESTGIVNPIVEMLAIAGGDLDVDKFLVETGVQSRVVHERMKIKALNHEFSRAFIKGDTDSQPREIDGLQKRVTGTQLVSNSAGTGAALSLFNLDLTISRVTDPTHILLNTTMGLRLSASTRATGVSGYLTHGVDEFGRQITMYNNLPLIVVDGPDTTSILPFNEAAAGGGTASTSIYVVSFQDGMLNGIQTGPPMVSDLGELQTKPVMRTRVEWYAGVAAFHGRSAARLYGITDAAVVA